MTTSSNTRRLTITIVILLITNLAILAYFLLPKMDAAKSKSSTKAGYGMMETLRRVGLDSTQEKELDRLREEHWKKMRPMFEDLQTTKSNFYALLKTPETPDSILNHAAAQIGEKQKAIDLQVFTHFKNSRMVCTPAQRPTYDSLVQIILKRMASPSRNNNRNNNNRKKDS